MRNVQRARSSSGMIHPGSWPAGSATRRMFEVLSAMPDRAGRSIETSRPSTPDSAKLSAIPLSNTAV